MQRRPIHLLFCLSDCCAWLLVGVGVIGAFDFALVPPEILFRNSPPSAIVNPACYCTSLLLGAKGAFMLSERKPLGLLLLQAIGLLYAWQGQYAIAALWLGSTLLLFGLPLLLVWQEVRRQAAALVE
ncbi:hypothetical protein SAMN02745857_00835 [Andreprevotia lacus DSM 23236]|jgi:hypothetical protein|uniref:Uncharacterized protein n=1 Tax=Andreprevotia lacus DSM 23236 TaxID=1121001 RepID=A0A1W1X861_9NEIS|nr:hypothetical protein [Andreprevotia lacus]SMC20152.1 hypothetical protein SAMN02745857_00835 [Andreprevotia lacus DSM 23236]